MTNASAAVHTRIQRRLDAPSDTTIGSSCSSQARMPVSATAPAIAVAVSFAASYFTSNRCPIRSAEKSSRPCRCLNRFSIRDTSSRQSIPSTLKVDSACTSQTEHVADLGDISEHSHCVALCDSHGAPQPSPLRGLQAVWFGADFLRRRPFLDVLEPLLEKANDVLIVEGVEHHSSLPAGANQPHAAKQPQLVRDG